VIITFLRFIYLTLPFCAGTDLKTLNKEEKQEKKSTKRQKDEVTRLQLAMASSKSKQRQEGIFTRPQLAMASDQRANRGRSIVLHALNSPWRVNHSPWRVHLLERRARAVKLLKDDVAQTHW